MKTTQILLCVVITLAVVLSQRCSDQPKNRCQLRYPRQNPQCCWCDRNGCNCCLNGRYDMSGSLSNERDPKSPESAKLIESADMTVPTHSGFSTIKIIARIFLNAVFKFWTFCSTALLILVLLYWLYGGLVAFGLLLAGLIGLFYKSQDLLLYYPNQPATARIFVETPRLFGLPFENYMIPTKDGQKINAQFIKQPVNKLKQAPTFLYFHGNAGNIGHRLLNAVSLHQTLGVNVLLVEYRGYGKSTGSPGENGIYKDATAAMEFLLNRSDIDRSRIVCFGRSLGGAVATYLATLKYYEHRVMCLIVENTFTSLPDIGKNIFDFKFLQHLPKWAFKSQYPTESRLRHSRVPVLFLSGSADTLIPPQMMQRLYDCCSSPLRRIAKFPGGTHNETWQCHGYHDAIARFLYEVEHAKNNDGVMDDNGQYCLDIPFDDHGLSRGSVVSL